MFERWRWWSGVEEARAGDLCTIADVQVLESRAVGEEAVGQRRVAQAAVELEHARDDLSAAGRHLYQLLVANVEASVFRMR